MRKSLTHRPFAPGSDQHRALLARTNSLGRTLYPSLWDRRDEQHRRACAAMAAAGARVATKQETGELRTHPVSTTFDLVDGLSGCNTECA